MEYKAPATIRTSRTIAEEKGTDPEGFVKSPDYFAQGGHPITKDLKAQPYTEPVAGTDVPPTTANAATQYDPSPFTIKGA